MICRMKKFSAAIFYFFMLPARDYLWSFRCVTLLYVLSFVRHCEALLIACARQSCGNLFNEEIATSSLRTYAALLAMTMTIPIQQYKSPVRTGRKVSFAFYCLAQKNNS